MSLREIGKAHRIGKSTVSRLLKQQLENDDSPTAA
jgi:DNA-directed RNA polymerase specialized sigma subunit